MRTSDALNSKDDADLDRIRDTLVLHQAREAGLLGGRKAARISGRISTALLDAAKERAHVSSDAELLELALSRLAGDYIETSARYRDKIGECR